MTLEQELRRVFGQVRRTNSIEWTANCPKCVTRVGKPDTKFHLYIHPTKYSSTLKKYGAWHCHRCLWKGWGLDSLGIKTIEEDSKLIELKYLGDRFRNKAPLTENLEFPETFSNEFSNSNLGMRCFNYLTKTRGLRPDQVFYYKLGFCSAGRYKNCVILPVYDNNKLVYFVGRDITQKRYMNPPQPNRGILFNYTGQDTIVLTEGIFDAIAVGYNGVALLGKFLKEGQRAMLAKGMPKTTYIMLDKDAKKEAVEMARVLAKSVPDVRLASTYDKKDPGSMTEQEVAYSLAHSYPTTMRGMLRYLHASETKNDHPT
jgi:hypothetical protein